MGQGVQMCGMQVECVHLAGLRTLVVAAAGRRNLRQRCVAAAASSSSSSSSLGLVEQAGGEKCKGGKRSGRKKEVREEVVKVVKVCRVAKEKPGKGVDKEICAGVVEAPRGAALNLASKPISVCVSTKGGGTRAEGEPGLGDGGTASTATLGTCRAVPEAACDKCVADEEEDWKASSQLGLGGISGGLSGDEVGQEAMGEMGSRDVGALPVARALSSPRELRGAFEWVRSTVVPAPRKLPVKVSKWRKDLSRNARQVTPVVVAPSERADEIMRCLAGARSGEDVKKVMEEFVGRVSPLEVGQMISELGCRRDWLTALQLFEWLRDEAGWQPDEGIYRSIIKVLAKAKRMDKVEQLIACMKAQGLEPGVQLLSDLVLGYVKCGTLHKGVVALERMRDQGMQPSVCLYNSLIDGCSRIPKGWETAISLFDTMKQDKVVPDRATFTTMLLLACRKARYSSAVAFFSTMLSHGHLPDKSVYHAVLNSYAKLGDMKNMLRIFEELTEQRMEYGVMSYNVVLNALSRAGETEKVSHFYRRMRKAAIPADLQTCSILITAFGKARGWVEMDMVLEEMQSSGLQPDLTVYNSLISVYGKAGRLDEVEQIVNTVIAASDDGKSKVSFDLVTYNTLIDVYGKAGRLEDVKFWFADLKSKALSPDVKTFNALLNAYGKAGLFDGVTEVLRLFREHGNKPDVTFYNTLLFTFGRAGKYRDAWQIVADMEQAGCYPSVEIFNSLMFVFGRGSQPEAMKVYSYMIERGVSPNATTFKLLIDIHGKRGMVDECLHFYAQSLRSLGKSVNDSLLSSVFGACCNMRRIEDAEKLLDDVHGRHHVSVACHNWLILGYGRKGLWRKSEQVFQETMVRKKLVPNGQTYAFLLEAYGVCGELDKGEGVVERLKGGNLLNGIGGYNAVLRFYVRCKRFEDAFELHDKMVDGEGPQPNHTSYAVLMEAYGCDEGVNRRVVEAIRGMKVKLSPKVVVYTALLAALTRCGRGEDALGVFDGLRMLEFPAVFGELLLLDDMGGDEDERWLGLGEEMQSLEREGLNSEMQTGFHNALIDALWILGWEVRALRVLDMSMERGIFGKDICTWEEEEWVIRLHSTSLGAAQLLLLTWIAQMQAEVERGLKVPHTIRIVLATAWQVRVQDNLSARQVVLAQLRDLRAPFANLDEESCELLTSGTDFLNWLAKQKSGNPFFLSNCAANEAEMQLLRKQAQQRLWL